MLIEKKDRIQSLPELTVEQKVVVLNFLLGTDIHEFFHRNSIDGFIPLTAMRQFVAVDPLTKPSDSSIAETANKFVHNTWDSWNSPYRVIHHLNGKNVVDYDTFIHFALDKVPSNHSRGGAAKWQVVSTNELNWDELVVGLSGIRDVVYTELIKNNIRLQKEVNSWRDDSGKIIANNQGLMAQIEEIRTEASSQIEQLTAQLEEYYFKSTDLESKIVEITKDADSRIDKLNLYLEEADERNVRLQTELEAANRSIVANNVESRKKLEKLEKLEIELERSRQLNARLLKQIENLKESKPHENDNGVMEELPKNPQKRTRGSVDKVQDIPTWNDLHLTVMNLILFGDRGKSMNFAEVGKKLGISEVKVRIAFEDAQERFQIWLDDVTPQLVNSEVIEKYFSPTNSSEIVYEDHEEESDLDSVNVD